MGRSIHDANHVPSIIGVSILDFSTPLAVSARLLTASTPLDVAVVDSTGAQLSTFPISGTVSTIVTDIAPVAQNVTVIDSGSSSATGANNQTVIIGTPTVGSAASFALSSIETVRIMVTGIWTGTLTAEQSLDGGTTWTTIGVHQGSYTTSSFTAGFVGGANIAGATNFRMRATAAITGTAVVKIIESLNTQSVYIANAAPAGNVISVLNSSTATLLAGATYTGTGEDVSNFSEMRVSVKASHTSATDGFSIQQSSDNVNWDIIDTYTIAATTGKTFVVPRQARYFRMVYTNGGTNQSSFRLQSILNRTATAASSQRAQDAYSNENDLEQVWAFNSLFNGTTWDMMRGDIPNGLDVDVTRLSSLVAGTAIIGKVGIDQTTPGTTNLVALAANQSVNVAQMSGIAIAMNTGTRSTGTQRVTIATDDVVPASQSGTWTVQPGNTANTTPWLTQPTPVVTATPLSVSLTDALVATPVSVKSSSGRLFGYHIYNPNTSTIYVHFYDTASGSVSVGTTTRRISVAVPAFGLLDSVVIYSIYSFATAISIAATTTLTGTTAPTTGLLTNIFYI